MSSPSLRLTLVTDAWEPQTNGVVTTFKSVLDHFPELGIEATIIHPGLFQTLPLPSYPEIRIARNPAKLRAALRDSRPDAVHIATEGPLGMAARGFCRRHGLAFTTSLHTKFPEYVQARIGLPVSVGYRFIRWFHGPSRCTLVTTASHRDELSRWGLKNLLVWSRGVDTERFQPLPSLPARERPRLLYVGRVAVEKNIEAFLELSIDADKVVVGDGPARAELERDHPEVAWLGYRKGSALVAEYAQADAFVFPSLTDTFGLVMLEAMACGTPVAAYPVTGPKDVVRDSVTGALDEDLSVAVKRALKVSRSACRAYAEANSWRAIAERMARALVLTDGTVFSVSSLSTAVAASTIQPHDASTNAAGFSRPQRAA